MPRNRKLEDLENVDPKSEKGRGSQVDGQGKPCWELHGRPGGQPIADEDIEKTPAEMFP